MCGITGFAGRRSSQQRAEAVMRMTHAVSARGPDSAGFHEWRTASFGHRRLAIFDLSDLGNQPMLSPDGRLGVVFNGAIYNFRGLRRDLEARGCSFQSETDTEVLVHGYREWGINGLVSRLRGMFAFALWDDDEERLFLVRDRLGVKPLVFVERDEGIAFASTVRALRAAGLTGDLSHDAIAEFLQFGFITEERAIYVGVRKLPPACILEWSARGATLHRYWSPDFEPSSSISFDDAVDESERLLLDAVRVRLQADVPVAALLSGGIDSSLVCWAIRELGADVTAYTVGTPGGPEDETADAVATAQTLGIAHEVLPAHDSHDIDVSSLGRAFAEPFACSSALGMMRLSAAIAATPAKVVLTGDGGDDVFLGYGRHLLLLRTQHVATYLPRMAPRLWQYMRPIVPHWGPFRRLVHLLDYTTGGLPAFLAANPGYSDFVSHRLLGERFADAQVAVARDIPSSAAARGALRDYLAHDLTHQFVSEYLLKVDGATMHFALEARSPFLDQKLWEFASTLPFELRLHGGLKAILRAIARRRLGRRVATGRKRGFTVPIEKWMGGRWHEHVRQRLSDGALVREHWVRAQPLREELRRAAQTGAASRRLWFLWALEEWMRAEASAESSASLEVSPHAWT